MRSLVQLAKDFPASFASAGFYRSLVTARQGIGLGFLLIATLIGTAHLTAVSFPALKAFIEKAQPVLTEFPEVTIKGGALSFAGEATQTFTLTPQEGEEPYKIVFDSTGQAGDAVAAKEKMKKERIVILVEPSRFVIYDFSQDAADVQDYKQLKDTVVRREDWGALGQKLAALAAPVSVVTLFFFVFLGHVATVALGALLILVIAPLFKVGLHFAAAMRIASAAKMPIATIFVLVTPHVPLQAALWFGFVAFGLVASRGLSSRQA